MDYLLIRKPRRRTLSITISADNRIIVKARSNTCQTVINDFILKKTNWIQKTLNFNKYVKKPYIAKVVSEGEEFLYLGEKYFLDIKIAKAKNILIAGDKLLVEVTEVFINNKNYLKKMITSWYKEQASNLFLKRLRLYEELVGFRAMKLLVRNFKRTWGNCSRQGIISLNWRLIMAPLEIIDYVIIHELLHIKHHNHSKVFWRHIEELMPDYKQKRRWLTINDNEMRL